MIVSYDYLLSLPIGQRVCGVLRHSLNTVLYSKSVGLGMQHVPQTVKMNLRIHLYTVQDNHTILSLPV